jgi:hypothetical protein
MVQCSGEKSNTPIALLIAHSITTKAEPIMICASCHIIQGWGATLHANRDVGLGVGAKLGRCQPANAPPSKL